MLYIVDLEGMITEHAACGNQFVFIPVVSCIECLIDTGKEKNMPLLLHTIEVQMLQDCFIHRCERMSFYIYIYIYISATFKPSLGFVKNTFKACCE